MKRVETLGKSTSRLCAKALVGFGLGVAGMLGTAACGVDDRPVLDEKDARVDLVE